MDRQQPYLAVEKVSKQFPGTLALDEIDFDLFKGEVHAVVGENGAGKSTLMKILSGAYLKTSGRIMLEGEEINLQGVDSAQKLGINMIYQELSNLPKLSVAENIFLGVLPRRKILGAVDFNTLYRDSRVILENYGLAISPKQTLAKLTVAEKQFIEIIRVISAKNAKIIIMDEPTSSLSRDETETLFRIINELKKKNVTIIYISHRLDEVVTIADRLSVFRDGKNRGTLERGMFDEEKIITLMLGHSLEREQKKNLQSDETIFEVKNLSIRRQINGFNMHLKRGEVLGIAGRMGSGKDALVKSLFGLWPAQSKELFFKGNKINIRNPKDALKHKLVYLPEERKVASLFLQLSVKYNISPLHLFNVYGRFFLKRKPENELSAEYISKLNIKTTGPAETIINLSGGNQQKAIFARLLAIQPEMMILNDPTRGIDVGSKEEIYREIHRLSAGGTSIILVSSEIEEIVYLSNKVIVLSRGDIVGEFEGGDVTLKNILTCAVRVKK
ncbi:MAG: sugar ABC transporter ATP-binding protein [Spirochaetales bacterium]|nr:MAG: sugar ABC transporter ATP-binding protein [Spirochaetales bacterium]